MSENTMNNLKIGADVDGTKVEAILVDVMGTVLDPTCTPAGHGNDAVIEGTVTITHQATGERFGEVRVIDVGTPGIVDSASGHVDNIVNPDMVSPDMGPLISQRSDMPVHMESNINAAAVSVVTVLDGADGMADTIAFLNFGAGLAAGIVENGVPMHGCSGAAGEIGHIPIEPHHLKCPCGRYGCLETVCSGVPMGRLWPNADPLMPNLIRRVKKREAGAVGVLDTVVRAISDTIQILAQSVDPRLIVLGGGMAKTDEPLVEMVTAELRRRESQCQLLETLDLPARLRLAPVDQPVGTIGATIVA